MMGSNWFVIIGSSSAFIVPVTLNETKSIFSLNTKVSNYLMKIQFIQYRIMFYLQLMLYFPSIPHRRWNRIRVLVPRIIYPQSFCIFPTVWWNGSILTRVAFVKHDRRSIFYQLPSNLSFKTDVGTSFTSFIWWP